MAKKQTIEIRDRRLGCGGFLAVLALAAILETLIKTYWLHIILLLLIGWAVYILLSSYITHRKLIGKCTFKELMRYIDERSRLLSVSVLIGAAALFGFIVLLIVGSVNSIEKASAPSPAPTAVAVSTTAPSSTPVITTAPTVEPTPDKTEEIKTGMQAQLDTIKSGANGTMIYAEAYSDKIYFVALSNSWYAWTKEQKEYIINELYSNLRNKHYELSGDDSPIYLTIYDENRKTIADSKMFGGIELK